MTVICYRKAFKKHPAMMASDGRLTQDNTIVTNNCEKIFRLKDGSLLGLAGGTDGCEELLVIFNKRKTSKRPPISTLIKVSPEVEALLVCPDSSIWIIDINITPKTTEDDPRKFACYTEVRDEFVAIGSGAKWAMGAMDRGASAKEAVETAIKYDSHCGGTARVFELNV